MNVRWVVPGLLAAVLAAGCSTSAPEGNGTAPPVPGSASASPSATPGRGPLAGRVVVLDPGHQLGNRAFGSEIGEPVDAGGFTKECNTTGTATRDGFPEATFTWQVALEARRELERLGARVVLTRTANTDDAWGPCVDERGRIGNPGQPGPTADLRISIHADGVLADGATGFHVIRPERLDGWTDDIAKPSRRLAVLLRDALVRAGFAASSYRGREGIDVRGDLGTLNLSDVPAVMAELGNMRDPQEGALMESRAGQRRYARAIVAAARAYLGVSGPGRQG